MLGRRSSAVREWSIGLISTDYDLHEVRASVRRKVAQLGFRPVAFETVDFPVQAGVHSHEACVLAVETMDIVVLVVDRRFGGPYCGVGPKSITEMELQRALLLGKPVIPCVSKSAWDARKKAKRALAKAGRRTGKSATALRKEVIPEYVEGWNVVDFLDRIQHLPHDQYLVFFEDSGDLLKQLTARLRHLSVDACRSLVRAQLEWLQSQRSTNGLFESLGGIGGSDLHVEPPAICTVEGRIVRSASLVLQRLESTDTTVVVTGGPGMGKSVCLTRAFQRHAERALRSRSFRLPFFVSLRGRGTFHHFKISKFLSESFREHLGKEVYPLLDLRDLRPVFYMDGMDEGSVEPSKRELARVAESEMLRQPGVVAVRDAFARRNIEQCQHLASRFAAQCTLARWSRREAATYVRKYAARIGNSKKVGWLRGYVQAAQTNDPVVESPLLLSLFVWLCTQPEWSVISHREMGLASLFAMFLERWAWREVTRVGAIDGDDGDKGVEAVVHPLELAWENAAWHIWRERRRRRSYLTLEALKDGVGKSAPACRRVVEHPAFVSLLSTSERSGHVVGMVHEQFIEYLLARSFVDGCLGGGFPVHEYLAYQLNADATRFVKSIWASLADEQLEHTIRLLEGIADRNRRGGDLRRLMTVANCIYYISRVPAANRAAEALRRLLAGERRLYPRNGILFALVRLGDSAAEEQLFDSISGNTEASMVNRGLHLEYFGDSVAVEGRVPPRDDGGDDWSQCLEGLVSHFDGTDARMVATRRIDLLTIRSFLEARRKLGPFGTGHYARLEQCMRSKQESALLDGRQRRRILAEWGRLQKVLLRLGYAAVPTTGCLSGGTGV